MKKPFTKEEQEVMNLLLRANDKFNKLERTHPMEVSEWVTSFHHLQDLLGWRVLRRDYPDSFGINNIKNKLKNVI